MREALRQACAELPAATELDSLRRTLLGLAIDADVVLDLHCDNEAVLHLYTTPESWTEVEPLARLLGSRAVLVAEVSGDEPFDEACSMAWPRVAAELTKRLGRSVTLPYACTAVTIELRGEADVSHELAARDAEGILQYLAVRGLVEGAPASLPPLLCEPTPLAGSIPVAAPIGGVVVWAAELGSIVQRGQPLAEIVDPMSGEATTIASPTDGVLYARENRRFVPAGTRIAKVAGREAVRSGRLLSD